MDTTGFEEFGLDIENLPKQFSLEKTNSHRKQIVLIAAPAEFDVSGLKGEVFVENGINTIKKKSGEEDEEDNNFQWDIHASPAQFDTHFNLLLPSSECKGYKIAPSLSWHLNIVRSMQLPNLKYPKVSKRIKRLAKPEDLSVRWKPFGEGTPLTKLSNNALVKTGSKKYDKGAFIQKQKNQNKGRLEEEHTENTEENIFKKKSKKKIKKKDLEEEEDIFIVNKSPQSGTNEHLKKKTEKRKIEVKEEQKSEEEEIEQNHTPKIKKKRKIKDEVIEENVTKKKGKREIKEEVIEENVTKKKKKGKREIIEEVIEENVTKKKKKRKKIKDEN